MSESRTGPWYMDTEFYKRFSINCVASFLVLLSLYCGLWLLGVNRIWKWPSVGGLGVLSLPISFLITGRSIPPNDKGNAPTSLWGFLDRIIIKEPSNLAILVLFIAGVGIGTYYFVSSLFTFEYTRSGFQVNLPGHTIYYVPIIPTYDKWQNTGIRLRKGDDVEVEIIGYASTTALWGLVRNTIMRISNSLSVDKKTLEKILEDIPEPRGYTDAAGSPEEWYASPPIIPSPSSAMGPSPLGNKQKTERPLILPHYKEDKSLTVMGLPHNTIVGIIDDKEPEAKQHAYDWTGEEDNRGHLVKLSSKQYPLNFDSKWSGMLWVIVNDAQDWRWDNSGIFFMSVKVSSGFFSGR